MDGWDGEGDFLGSHFFESGESDVHTSVNVANANHRPCTFTEFYYFEHLEGGFGGGG